MCKYGSTESCLTFVGARCFEGTGQSCPLPSKPAGTNACKKIPRFCSIVLLLFFHVQLNPGAKTGFFLCYYLFIFFLFLLYFLRMLFSRSVLFWCFNLGALCHEAPGKQKQPVRDLSFSPKDNFSSVRSMISPSDWGSSPSFGDLNTKVLHCFAKTYQKTN